jgi:aminoglycoside 6'-N-acetyltransferase I
VGSAVAIREAGVESFETAFHLLERFFREEGFRTPAQDMRASLHTMITAPGSAVFLAWRGQQAVGVATVSTSVGIEYGRSAELEDLYVLPVERGSGVGRALIEAVCAWCREWEVSAVLVTVTPEGERAHKLVEYYRQRGFANTRRVILERILGDGR